MTAARDTHGEWRTAHPDRFPKIFDHVPRLSPDALAILCAVKVLVVDDQRMVADGLVHVLSAQPGIEAVRSAHSVAETRVAVTAFAPDVVVVDWTLPDGDGASVVAAVRATCPEARVLVLADLAEAGAVTAALSSGCDGFVTRDRGLDEVVGRRRRRRSGRSRALARRRGGARPRPSRP